MKDLQDLRTNNFDLVRLFACLQVATLHAGHYLSVPRGPALQAAFDTLNYFPGVNTLFVVSGFLITMSFDKRPFLGAYARNRFLRIYPGLFVSFLATLVVLQRFGFLHWSPKFAAWAAAQLTVAQWYDPKIFREFGMGQVNPPLWTISIEIQWYFLCPMLAWVMRRLRTRARQNLLYAALILASAALCYTLGREGLLARALWAKLASVTIAPFLFVILLGAAAYRNFDLARPLVEGKFVYWTAGYVAFRLAADRWLKLDADHTFALLLVGRAMLAMWTLSLAFTWRTFSEKALRGQDLSYGAYIYHMLVVNVMIELGCVRSRAWMAAALGVTLALAAASWWLVEKPALRLKRRALRPVEK